MEPGRWFGDDVSATMYESEVVLLEFHRPPFNFVDPRLLAHIADAYTWCASSQVRAIVLCSQGKHFCAGAELSTDEGDPSSRVREMYAQALRLFDGDVPVIAAVQGAAIGAGLGLACSADFRVACDEARFAANFAVLGTHHGFGLSVTLPAVIGTQATLDLMYSGRRVSGIEAAQLGLCDRLVPLVDLRSEALALADSIAASAPLAVRSIRRTMRGHLRDSVAQAMEREIVAQQTLSTTADHREGIVASAERRKPRFTAT